MTVPRRRFQVVAALLLAAAIALAVLGTIAIGQGTQSHRDRAEIRGLRQQIAQLELDNSRLYGLAVENGAKLDALRMQLALLGQTPIVGPSSRPTPTTSPPPTTTTTSRPCVVRRDVLGRRISVCP